MDDIINFLFGSQDMMPHGYCFLWNRALLWLFVLSNSVISLAYFSIPVAIGVFAYKRRDINFKWMLILFGIFIFSCGITHALSVVTIWHPVYGLAGIMEAITAIVSVITAFLLWPLIPKALNIPSQASLLAANKKLEDEISYHKETKAQLYRLNTKLDHLVELRTRELQISEERFRAIFAESPLGIAVINAQTGYFYEVNPRFLEISGCSADRIKNTDWMSITHPDDVEMVRNQISKLETGNISVFNVTKRYLQADKTEKWVRLSSVVLKTESSAPCHLQMIEDVTEHRLAEQKSQLLGNILEQSINEVYLINSESLRYEHVNQGGLSNLGYALEQIKQMTLLDILPAFDAASFRHLIRQLKEAKNEQLRFESIHQRSDGTRYFVDISLQLYHNKPDYFLAICLDIDQRKAHEQKISRLSNFYASLSKINHAIVQINSEQDLFNAVCSITAGLQHVKLVWIGKPDPLTHYVSFIARAGDYQDYVTNLSVSVGPDIFELQDPTSLAWREQRVIAINDFQNKPGAIPWLAEAKSPITWGSVCSLPIFQFEKPYALLNVYSLEKDFFDDEVLKLLKELSLDLSFALDSFAHEAARRIAEEKLELSAKVFSQSQEAIIITDKDNNILSVNRAFTAITGYEEHEVLAKKPKILSSGRQDKDFYREMWDALLKINFWQGEILNRHKNGTIFPEWLTISVVRDESGEPVNYIANFSDISQHKLAEQQIEHLAHYDSLTDLPNRILLKSRVDYELIIAERHKQTFAVLFIDLDHFKNINDSLGHSIGDQVLIEVGRRLQKSVRDEDTVARLGGDEFNIILAKGDANGAAIVADKLITSLSKPIFYQNYQLFVTPSIGISLYPHHGDNYETLSKNADTALYQAKKNGRNQFQFFTSTMQDLTKRRMDIENNLRQAISRNELTIFFQPQVNTLTLQIVGAEALLRWSHPVWGMISPAEFIPIAEETGLILPIGDWVLEQSIAQAKQWLDQGYPITIAVNLSMAQFRAYTLFEKVNQLLELYNLPAKYLELELTESIAMQNVEIAIEVTNQLTLLGIKLSIDDFGTGYSSLNYLQRFSLHKLKIDQSFTKNMQNNRDSENIIDAIINMAKSLNLKTIAEGVENNHQFEMFKGKGCDEIQGYFFSRPIPSEQFLKLMQKGLE